VEESLLKELFKIEEPLLLIESLLTVESSLEYLFQIEDSL